MRFVSVQKNIYANVPVVFFIFAFFLFLQTAAYAQNFNQQINYQAKLTDNTGATVTDGSYSIEFKLYTQASGGVAIWTETASTTVIDGLFSYMLGSSSSLSGVDFNQTLYLGVNIGGVGSPVWDGEMTPRKIFGAVPAAFEAKNFGGLATTSFLRSDTSDVVSGLLTFTNGFISQSSSTITELMTATTTTEVLTINGESYTALSGGSSGIINSGGVLSANISESNLNIASAPTNGYVLQASSTATGGFIWQATSSLGFSDTDTTLTTGTDNQIPFSNAGGTDFDYSNNLTYDGSDFILQGGGAYIDNATLPTSRYGSSTLEVYTSAFLTGLTPARTGTTTFFDSSYTASNAANEVSSTELAVSRFTGAVFGSGEMTVSGALTNFRDECVEVAGGTCISTNDVMQLNQKTVSNTGSVLNVTSASTNGGFVFRANDDGTFNDSTPTVITQTGNVGIGTSSPNAKLDVWGDFQVGTSGTPVIMVDTGGSSLLLGFLNGGGFLTTDGSGVVSTSTVGIANMTSEDYGDFSISSGVASLNDNSIDASDLRSDGGFDEYCLTYEDGYPSLLQWQDCNSGALTFGTDNQIPFSNAGGTDFDYSNNFTFDGNDLTLVGGMNLNAAGDSTISTLGSVIFRASTTLNNISLGEDAGASYSDVSGGSNLNNVAIGYQSAQYASSTFFGFNNNNIFVGYRSGYYNTGNNNAFLGYQAGFANTGSYNIGLGYGSLTLNSGSTVTAIGYLTGSNNTGDYNLFAGNNSGYNNTGSNNTILGPSAGYNSAGDYNEIIGSETGGLLNATRTVAIGSEALRGGAGNLNIALQYQAVNNVAVGYRAGYSSQTGASNNILLGYQAADSLTTGANNIIIGYDVEAPSNTNNNQLNIGNAIFGTGLSATGTDIFTGNIGISTSTPGYTLTVDGDIMGSGRIYDNNYSAGTNGMVLQTTGVGFEWVATSSLGFPTGHDAVTLAGEDFLSLTGQQITANAIDPDNLSASDFGDFTCNGTTCTFDANTVSASELAAGIGLSTFIDDVGYLQDITGASFLDLADTPGSFANTQLLYMDASDVISSSNLTFDGSTLSVQTTGTADIFNLFETGGVEVFTVLENGNVGIGTTSPASKLDVWGDFRVGTSGTPLMFADASANQLVFGTTTPFNAGAASIYLEDTGITFRDQSELTRSYTISTTDLGYLNFQGSTAYLFDVGNSESARFTNTGIVVNEEGNLSYDFRVESDNDTHLFFTDASADTIGISTSTPGYTLTVDGDIMGSGRIYDNNYSAGTNGMVLQTTGVGFEWVATSSLGIGGSAGTVTSVDMSVPTGFAISGNPITTNGTLALTYDTGYAAVLTASTTEWDTAFDWGDHSLGGYLTSVSPSDLSLVNGFVLRGGGGNTAEATSTLFIAQSSNVGIGTTSPASKLDVWGDFRVGTSGVPTLLVDSVGDKVLIGTSTPNDATLTVLGGISSPSGINLGDELFGSNINLVGNNSTYNTLIGDNITLSSTNNGGSVVIGSNSTVSGSGGRHTSIGTSNTVSGSGVGTTVTIGYNLANSSNGGVVVGSNFTGVSNNGMIGVGWGSTASQPDSAAFGWGMNTSKAGEIVFGSRRVASVTPSIRLTGSTGQFQGRPLFDVQTSWVDDNDLSRLGQVTFSTFDYNDERVFLQADSDGSGVVTSFNGGNVGIGTSSPASKLDVWGDFRVGESGVPSISSNNAGGYISIGDDTMKFYTSGLVTQVPDIQMAGAGIVAAEAGFILNIDSDDSGAASAFIIGHNASTTAATQLFAFNESGNMYFDGDIDTYITHPEADMLSFTTGGAEALRIDDSGNVGVGTSSPASKLDVWGDFRVGDSGTPNLFVDPTIDFVGIGTSAQNGSEVLSVNGNFALNSGYLSGDGGTEGMSVDAFGSATFTGGTGSTYSVTINNTNGGPASGRGIRFVDDGNNMGHISVINDGSGADTYISFNNRQSNSVIEVMRMESDGNITISTSTVSTARLSVQTEGTTDIINLFETGGAEVFTVLESGSVGIGTTSPASLLDVYGDVQFGTSTAATLFVGAAAHKVGIGTITPDSELDVIGTVQASNLLGGATGLSTDVNGNIIRDPSDQRLKTNVKDIEDALEKVLSLRGVSYEWKDSDRFGDQTEIGFLAQEVDDVLPEVVRKGGEYWSLRTQNIVSVVVVAIQEMWEKVIGLEEKVAEIDDLTERIEALEAALNIEHINDEDDDFSEKEEDDTSTTTESVADEDESEENDAGNATSTAAAEQSDEEDSEVEVEDQEGSQEETAIEEDLEAEVIEEEVAETEDESLGNFAENDQSAEGAEYEIVVEEAGAEKNTDIEE